MDNQRGYRSMGPATATRRTGAEEAAAAGRGARRAARQQESAKLPLSGLISQTLEALAERDRQRGRLVTVLTLAQAFLTVATALGYIGAPHATLSLALGGAAVAVYLGALALNSVFRRPEAAVLVLIFGGALAALAQMLAMAITGAVVEAALTSLLFVAIILEAGVLLAPELALLLTFAIAGLTAFALLLALTHVSEMNRHQAYLLMVYALGVQLLAGLIAWLVAQFIFEMQMEAQRSRETQFAQARLDALMTQVSEQQRYLGEGITGAQRTITQVLGGDYTARIEGPERGLGPLVESINILLQRLESLAQAEQARLRMDAASYPLLENLTRLTESGGTPTPSSLPIMTNTPMDSVSVAVSQMSASVTQRLGRIQRQAGDLSVQLSHSQEPLTSASETMQEAQRLLGGLIAMTKDLTQVTRQQLTQLTAARRMLATALPAEITQLPAGGLPQRDWSESSDLEGLGHDLGVGTPGYTGVFSTLGADDGGAYSSEGIAPLTRPLPIIEFSPTPEASVAGTGDAAELRQEGGEQRAELVEAWRLLGTVDGLATQIERAMSLVARELGIESRHLHTADVQFAWFRQALNAMRGHIELIQQATGSELGATAAPSRPLAGGMSAIMGQPGGPSQPRGAQASRPLTQQEQAFGEQRQPGSLRAADLVNLDTGEMPQVGERPQE